MDRRTKLGLMATQIYCITGRPMSVQGAVNMALDIEAKVDAALDKETQEIAKERYGR